MDKPMLVFKRFGHQIHLMVQRKPNVAALNLWVVARSGCAFLDNREKTKTWS